MITFLKHENALYTVYKALYGNTDTYSAYNAQCLFLNNSVDKCQRELYDMETNLTDLKNEYNESFVRHGALDENTKQLQTEVDALTLEIYDFKQAWTH